jgi:hypothetical protein
VYRMPMVSGLKFHGKNLPDSLQESYLQANGLVVVARDGGGQLDCKTHDGLKACEVSRRRGI